MAFPKESGGGAIFHFFGEYLLEWTRAHREHVPLNSNRHGRARGQLTSGGLRPPGCTAIHVFLCPEARRGSPGQAGDDPLEVR